MRRIAAITLLAFAAAAHAQIAKTQRAKTLPWAKEPELVFGLRLGERFDHDALKPCGGVTADGPPPKYSFCHLFGRSTPEAVQLLLSGFPVSAFKGGSLSLEGGVASTLMLEGSHNDHSDIRAVLIERYGPPTVSMPGTVSNRMGASFSNETLIWTGKNVMLTLRERSGKVDETGVFFQHIPSASKSIERDTQRRKGEASKM